uniref:Uncharacterized protein n=1 Tax=Vitrella brassicaformis TaxID=1169539 RepID=A0A7S1K030_9ALVE
MADEAGEEVLVVAEVVFLQSVEERPQLLAAEFLALVDELGDELDAVDEVDVVAEQLQREDGGLIAHVAVDHVGLDAQDAGLRDVLGAALPICRRHHSVLTHLTPAPLVELIYRPRDHSILSGERQ